MGCNSFYFCTVMGRKLLAFLLLLNHLNTSMFIPQMAEVDVYDRNGAQVDDINTLVEFIDQDVLGHHDSTPEDEDDDTERTYHITKSIEFSWHPYVSEIQTKVAFKEEAAIEFADYSAHKPTPGFTNIFIPPPKA
jgi:hypothetical protein